MRRYSSKPSQCRCWEWKYQKSTIDGSSNGSEIGVDIPSEFAEYEDMTHIGLEELIREDKDRADQQDNERCVIGSQTTIQKPGDISKYPL